MSVLGGLIVFQESKAASTLSLITIFLGMLCQFTGMGIIVKGNIDLDEKSSDSETEKISE